MSGLNWSWQLDGWITGVAILCAVASSLLGNFLVLRRMSMLGDAITHAVLPGLAVAFFISHSRSSLPMFLGAVLVGVLTAFFTEWIRRAGKVDEGASMGVVFTSLFALGLIMIVQAADNVDLDASCVLYGAIELTPLDKVSILGKEIPRAFIVLSLVTLLNAAFVTLFYKELKLSSFDPALATASGFNASLMHYLLMVLVAVTAVASFESVGSVLVVAMFIVPPAAAYMLTDRLPVMIFLSLLLGAVGAAAGHVAALVVPSWFGYQSTTTAGMMAVAVGALLLLATLFAPRYGIVIRWARHQLLNLRILADDCIAFLYRLAEQGGAERSAVADLQHALLCSRLSLRGALVWLRLRGDLVGTDAALALTPQGRQKAHHLIRSHRLWEQYLQDHAGLDASRVHPQAEKLEHFTNPRMRQLLDSATDAPQYDPHGKPIPSEQDGSAPPSESDAG